MAEPTGGSDLVSVVILLGAAVVAVPLFRRLGLGSVLGYLAAGLVIGPFGLGLFSDPAAILHAAELGVVMFLFIIGLEMEPSRLWSMRRAIFGLGLAQLLACMALLSCVGLALGFPLAQSFVAGTGFVLTSTAIVMQMLEERGEISRPPGQRIISILLLEDLAIVPILALVAFLAPGAAETTLAERLTGVAIGLGSILGLVLAGRYLLNPFFRLLAAARAREVMTAAALLVVLGSALAMQLGGLSTAMGAFLAGVLLSESSFRHQLEAEVEPFRGILLGLFFLAVGMSLDLATIRENLGLIAISVLAFMTLKALGIYGIARLFRASGREALERTVLMAQGGEFAFVLYAAATSVGLIDGESNAVLTAIIIVSMVLTPLLTLIHDHLIRPPAASMEGVDLAENLSANVLIIGFGRVGQILSQPILARGHSISIIDTDTQMIRDAAEFGFKVHYGDGGRLDILHAAGAASARAVVIAVNDREATSRIAELMRAEFPLTPVVARAWDREHALELVQAGVERFQRETFEDALALGGMTLEALGDAPETAAEVVEEVRRRDAERFALQLCGDLFSGRDLIRGNLKTSADLRS